MTVDEWAIRDTARDLAALYRELDALKYAPPSPRETRVMKPRPGPSVPGNWFAVALDADMVDRLVEIVCDARNHIEPAYCVGRDGATLCGWLAWNASAVAELDFADDIHQEMLDQTRRIQQKLPADETDQFANRPEPRQYAPAICQRLAGMGHRVTPDTLRAWASRSSTTPATITTEQRGAKNTYLLTEVLDFLHWRSEQRKHHTS